MKPATFLRQAVFALSMVLLVGCAGKPVEAPLPELSELPERETQMQRLTFLHQDQRHEMVGVLRHDENALRLALLSPQGQRLLTLVHDQSGSRFLDDAAFDPPFSAEWLASRISWSLWPRTSLVQAFGPSGWTLTDTEEGHTIRYHKRVIARISDDGECRMIEDLEADYRLYIAPIDNLQQKAASCPAD